MPRPRSGPRPAITLGLVLAIAAAAGAAVAGPGWKWKQKALGKGMAPAVAVDFQGHRHLLFGDLIDPGGGAIQDTVIDLVHTWTDGKAWFRETVAPDVGAYLFIDAAFDQAGVLHVAFGSDRDDLGLEGKLHYANNAGGSWTVEQVEDGGELPEIAVDEDGDVHIAHVVDDGAGHHTLRYVEQTAGGWVGATIDTPGWPERISLVLDGDKSHVAYADSGELWCATRSDGVWTTESIAPSVNDAANAELVLDGADTLHAFYRTGPGARHLAHAWRTPTDWESELLFDEETLFGAPLDVSPKLMFFTERPLAVRDFAGRVQLAFTLDVLKTFDEHDPVPLGTALITATWDDGAWLPKSLQTSARIAVDMAVSPAGIVHLASIRSLNAAWWRVSASAVRGTRLTTRVVPAGAGMITNELTGQSTDSLLREEIVPGAELGLTVTPFPGFTFLGWEQDASGTDETAAVVMDGPRKVIARFAPAP